MMSRTAKAFWLVLGWGVYSVITMYSVTNHAPWYVLFFPGFIMGFATMQVVRS